MSYFQQKLHQKRSKTYYEELNKTMTKYNLKTSPERIYNIDEKGLKINHTPPSIVTASSSTPVVTSGKGSTITIIGCGNTLKQQIPLYFNISGKRTRQELLHNFSSGTNGTVSETEWSNSDVFMTYLTTHFQRFFVRSGEDEPVLVLYDGHKCHISLTVIE